VDKIAQWTAKFLRAHLYNDRSALQQIYQRDRPKNGVTITSVLK